MAKDPAFLFYASDFLTGTMFMSMEDRGIYITLLCAQHQQGGLISKESFKSMVNNKAILISKFVETDEGFYNVRLNEIMGLRNQKSNNLSEAAKKVWEERKKYKSNTIVPKKNTIVPKNNTIVIQSVNENENEIITDNTVLRVGENFENFVPTEKSLTLEMLEVWKSKNPNYPSDIKKDLDPLYQISIFIKNQLQSEKQKVVGNPNQKITNSEILEKWEKIIPKILSEEFWKTKPLYSIQTNIQKFWMEQSKPKTKPLQFY